VAGNSKRKGAVRKPGSKKGATRGSGGQGRKALAGKGPTPKAEDRPYHPEHKRAKSAQRARAARAGGAATGSPLASSGELVVGRNAVTEALRAEVRAEALYVFTHIDTDDRVSEAVTRAHDAGIPIHEVPKADLDAATSHPHQGIVLAVAPFPYVDIAELVGIPGTPLIVVLDGIQDPGNLGAIARSALALGATGLLIPERRAAAVTAAAWRTSAGALARLPVARVTNLVRALDQLKNAGIFVVGLAAQADTSISDTVLLDGPVAIVVGSEGKGMARLTTETCDEVVSISLASGAESLNASVAAGIALHVAAAARAGETHV